MKVIRMGGFYSVQLGVLLSTLVVVTNGERYVVSDIISTNVRDDNEVFSSTHVKSSMQCARKCHGENCTSFTYGDESVSGPPECYPTTSVDYNGHASRTVSGEVCQRWDVQTPHTHSLTNVSKFPDATLADAANFCRDPDGELGPWCFTMNPDLRWEFCSVDKCDFEFKHERCYNDSLTARDYDGPWNRTRTGKVCQRWDKQAPHAHTYSSASGFPDITLSDAANYCRDPGAVGYTWCYTVEPGTKWEACDVSSCTKYLNDKRCYETDSYLQYTGEWDLNVQYTKCQRWDSHTPHFHWETDASRFPDDTLGDAANYCRDPDGEGFLWCFTIDPNVRFSSCGLIKCPPNHTTCYDDPTVRSYMGTWSKTETGKVCQRWDSQEPHSHSLTANMFEEDTLSGAENFCRDPTGSGELWCYTTDPSTPTENCGIGKCVEDRECKLYKDNTSLYERSSKCEYYTRTP